MNVLNESVCRRARVWPLGVAALLLISGLAQAVPPSVGPIMPRGGQRGTELDVRFLGSHFENPQEIMIYAPGIQATRLETPNPRELKAHFKIAADAPLGEYAMRVRTAYGISELRTFWVTPF